MEKAKSKSARTATKGRGAHPAPMTVAILCARAAGRCQFRGCNKVLFRDGVTLAEFNDSNVVHIVASSPKGARGSVSRSHKLSAELSNLMLMCPEHHKLIDDHKEDYPEEILQEMKAEREQAVELACESLNSDSSYMLFLEGQIKGRQRSRISKIDALEAMQPGRRPADPQPIVIDVECAHFHRDAEYWRDANRILCNKFNALVQSRLAISPHAHFSVYPLAPMSLIVKLGYLMGDKIPSDVYQHRRSPDSWQWQEASSGNFVLECRTPKPLKKGKGVALVVSMSAAKTPEERRDFASTVGARWQYELSATQPGVNCISNRDDLVEFWQAYQRLMERIRIDHPRCRSVSVLLVAPVSALYEIGRRYMPGVYPELKLYEYDGYTYFPTLTIGGDDADA